MPADSATIQPSTPPTHRLFSVGHSNHEIGDLIALLARAGVGAVADVRSQPFSQRLPQFNRPQLEEALKRQGITYTYLGDLLGGRPDSLSVYDADGRVDYLIVRATEPFQRGLDRLCRGLEQFDVAMLCAEEDPADCHRGLLVAPAMLQRGIACWHLRGDGRRESTDEFEARLLAQTKVGAGMLDGLFAAEVTVAERRELVEEAYRAQARRKAFRRFSDEAMQAAASESDCV